MAVKQYWESDRGVKMERTSSDMHAADLTLPSIHALMAQHASTQGQAAPLLPPPEPAAPHSAYVHDARPKPVELCRPSQAPHGLPSPVTTAYDVLHRNGRASFVVPIYEASEYGGPVSPWSSSSAASSRRTSMAAPNPATPPYQALVPRAGSSSSSRKRSSSAAFTSDEGLDNSDNDPRREAKRDKERRSRKGFARAMEDAEEQVMDIIHLRGPDTFENKLTKPLNSNNAFQSGIFHKKEEVVAAAAEIMADYKRDLFARFSEEQQAAAMEATNNVLRCPKGRSKAGEDVKGHMRRVDRRDAEIKKLRGNGSRR